MPRTRAAAQSVPGTLAATEFGWPPPLSQGNHRKNNQVLCRLPAYESESDNGCQSRYRARTGIPVPGAGCPSRSRRGGKYGCDEPQHGAKRTARPPAVNRMQRHAFVARHSMHPDGEVSPAKWPPELYPAVNWCLQPRVRTSRVDRSFAIGEFSL